MNKWTNKQQVYSKTRISCWSLAHSFSRSTALVISICSMDWGFGNLFFIFFVLPTANLKNHETHDRNPSMFCDLLYKRSLFLLYFRLPQCGYRLFAIIVIFVSSSFDKIGVTVLIFRKYRFFVFTMWCMICCRQPAHEIN